MKKYSYIIGLILIGFSASVKANSAFENVQQPQFKKDTFNIVTFGAKGDCFFLNTQAINQAIDKCQQKGGGVVMVPSGIWLTGPLKLKSNVNLHVSRGATLLFTKDFNEYKLVKTNWEGIPQMRNQSPISAENAVNIAITGNGIIDGNGDAWRMVKKDKLNPSQWKRLIERGGVLSEDKKTWYPSEKSLKGTQYNNPGAIKNEKTDLFYDSVKDFLRPNMILFTSCKNVLLQGVTFQNSAAWCLHPLMCENLTVKNIIVKNPFYAQNGDGIDVESCKNVWIENSVFDVGDDALCMKSGRDAEGRKRNTPTENVTIKGCTVYASHGGFVIGSEMSGGVKNVKVSNCTFIGTDIGLRFKTTRGRGGVVENIDIKDIYMKDIVGEAILFDMYYAAKDPIPLAGEKRELPKVEMKPVDETTPAFKNFNISNVYCNGAEKAIFVRGLPEKHIENIRFNNIKIHAKQGIDIQEASSLFFNNVTVYSEETNPVVDITNSDKINFNHLEYTNQAENLFRVSGERNAGINISNTDTSKSKEKLKLEFGALESAVKIN